MAESQLAEMTVMSAADADGSDAQVFLAGGTFWCLEAEIPIGAGCGRLLAGRGVPLDPETDRVLVRAAANIVGAISTAQRSWRWRNTRMTSSRCWDTSCAILWLPS